MGGDEFVFFNKHDEFCEGIARVGETQLEGKGKKRDCQRRQ
jgi:hypothetical protein